MDTIKPRAQHLNETLIRKGHAVHKDKRKKSRNEAKIQLRKEY